MNRRKFLAGLSTTGVLSLTGGCLSGQSPAENGTTTTTETATSTESSTQTGAVEVLPERPPETDIECGDGELDPIRRPSGGSFPSEAAGLELTASADTVALGDEITFSLRNRNSEETLVGTLHKYNIERLDGDDWTTVYYSPDREWYDVGVTLPPGGGYDWPFTFDREGLEREQESPRVSYYVCSDLHPGTYRFVFWGVIDHVVAVRFTVEEP